MIPKRDINKALNIARKYNIGQLYLIGSALHKDSNKIGDYDFAVKGVPSTKFFKFYGELIREMPLNVDLIDLSGRMTKFKKIILREGRLIYDKKAA